MDLLQLRLRKLRASLGDDASTAGCMYELARRLQGRARYEEAEELSRECLRIRPGLNFPQHRDIATYLEVHGYLESQL